jgi:hypothetical protein
MAKKIRVWDGTAWQDVAPSLPYTAIHSAQASMPLTGVDGQVWLDTDGTLAGQDFVPLTGGTMTGNLNVPSINSGPIVGRNKLLNGDFSIWQRGTSFSFADSIFAADRFKFVTNGGTNGTGTVTQQTFTPGAAPVAGYESSYYLRYNLTATGTSTQHYIQQNIEDVRTFAGQTITWSFWAKADSARVLNPQVIQRFGTGGSGATVTLPSPITLTTSWVRYSGTVDVPSVSTKTIAAGSSLELRIYWTTAANTTIDFWGWQVEAGSVATPFHTATPNQQTELAACQRYYYRFAATATNQFFGSAYARSATNAFALIKLPVTMRVAPSLSFASGASYFNFQIGTGDFTVTTLDGSYYSTTDTTLVRMTSSGMTAGQGGMALFNNASAYIEMSSEL